jgi:NAD+ synthase
MIKEYDRLIGYINNQMRIQANEAHTDKVAVGMSGGVDSALVARLSVEEFGPKNVLGIFIDIQSDAKFFTRAVSVGRKFGFSVLNLSLSQEYRSIVDKMRWAFQAEGLTFPDEKDPKNKTIFGGLKSCMRAPIIRFGNRAFGGGIVQGTGNMDEDNLLRFFQKGGDGEVDANWIGCLYKSEVWELAEYLDIPKDIIDAEPDHDLWGHISGKVSTDEEELEESAGVKLTYTRPGKDMGTIEWVNRLDEKTNVICAEADDEKLEEHFNKKGYNEEERNIIRAVRGIEQMTRHKILPPPSILRKDIEGMGLVE